MKKNILAYKEAYQNYMKIRTEKKRPSAVLIVFTDKKKRKDNGTVR